MKVAALPLSIILVIGAFAAPVAAQEEAAAEGEVACARLVSDSTLEGMGPVELGQLLIEGDVTLEFLAAESCEPEPPRTTKPAPKGTSYVTFAARGAGAVVELAALAKRHEGANNIAQWDRAARSIASWAKKQRRWLDQHPPQACYKSVHKQWRKGVVQVREAAKSVREALRTLRPAPMRRAVRQLTAGVDNLTVVELGEIRDMCVEAD